MDSTYMMIVLYERNAQQDVLRRSFFGLLYRDTVFVLKKWYNRSKNMSREAAVWLTGKG